MELETKRSEFDAKIEKWESEHSTRKMNWANANHNRKTEFENQSVFLLSESVATKDPQNNEADKTFTRKDLDMSTTAPTPTENVISILKDREF